MVKFNFTLVKHAILKFKRLDIETQYGFRYGYFQKNYQFLFLFMGNWSSIRSYTSSFNGLLGSATADRRSGFPYGGSSNFFLSLSKNINARIEDRSCGEWKQKKTRVIRVVIMLLSIFMKGTYHLWPMLSLF